MAYDGTIPALGNLISNDIPAMQENFSLLESAQVVDEGSTSDGDYIRYDNGWQICTDTLDSSGWNKFTDDHYEKQFDFPVEFINTNYKIITSLYNDSSFANREDRGSYDKTNTSVLVLQFRKDDDILVGIDVLAIGRWE